MKLAFRMLFKQPGLTLVAIVALAIGIPVGLLPLHVLHSLTTPLPVDDGEEIVVVRNYDRARSDPVMRPVHDFVQWRTELSSFEDLAMWREDLLNVNSDDGRAAPVRGAQVTASVFSLLRVPPLLGRPLDEADEAVGAPDVVVISYDLWQSRLAGDIRRLAAEPGVGPVAIASALPGMSHDNRYIQVEGLPRDPGAPAPAYPVNVARVDVGYFDALDQPILSGRNFNTADLGDDRSAVIVNTSFVERVLGGRSPLGRRLRYWEPGQEPGPWSFEIVGVVRSLGMNALKPEADQGIYHVVAPGELRPLSFAVRVGSNPERFTPRVRAIVSEIDASALIQDAVALADVPDSNRRVAMLWTSVLALLAGIAVVLSAACLYALMSFTVTERTRECGIRAALGARPANIIAAIGKRALLQLSVGVASGAVLSAAMLASFTDYNTTLRTSNWPFTVGLITVFVIVVGMLACVQPTLRAIRIRPVEALKG